MISFASLFSAPGAAPSYGEPEWMPSPAEVARARVDLERRGVVRSLTRDLAGAQMVPAGETPWAWLIGAALWIAIWPAVIALRFGTDRLDWLPWWLPIVLAVLVAVHFWRIRKDGGMAKPADADARVGEPDAETYPVFTDAPAKTYQLAAIVRGRTPAVGHGPERTLPAMPHLFYAELGVFMLTALVCLALSLVSDAPLKELANPAVPENPAKAPWYFLGLQELVAYSAFMGGMGIPLIVIVGLVLIPYLDRETDGTGAVSSRRSIRSSPRG